MSTRLGQFMTDHKIPSNYVADSVGITQPMISHIRNGKRRVHFDLFRDICKALAEYTNIHPAAVAITLLGFDQ